MHRVHALRLRLRRRWSPRPALRPPRRAPCGAPRLVRASIDATRSSARTTELATRAGHPPPARPGAPLAGLEASAGPGLKSDRRLSAPAFPLALALGALGLFALLTVSAVAGGP